MADPTVKQIPSSRVPLMDPATGYVSREWYLYWRNNQLVLENLESRVAALEQSMVSLEARVTALEP